MEDEHRRDEPDEPESRSEDVPTPEEHESDDDAQAFELSYLRDDDGSGVVE